MIQARSPLRAVDEIGRRILNAWTYRSEHVETSVGRAHVWRAPGSGELPPLLLIHGLGSSAMHWIPMLERLRAHVRGVVAVDLIGHGFSHRPEVLTHEALRVGLLEALAAVQAEPAVVIGNSLGGAAALRWALANPERTAGVLLFSPAGAPLTAAELARVRQTFTVDSYDDALRFMNNLLARPSRGLRSRLAAAWVRETLSDPVLRGWLETVPAFEEGDPEGVYVRPDEIRAVAAPVQVVWGRHDRILPPTGREFWRAHLPNGGLLEADHVGHTPYLDDVRWTADHIREFATRLRTWR